jgi:hypothetical protein
MHCGDHLYQPNGMMPKRTSFFCVSMFTICGLHARHGALLNRRDLYLETASRLIQGSGSTRAAPDRCELHLAGIELDENVVIGSQMHGCPQNS